MRYYWDDLTVGDRDLAQATLTTLQDKPMTRDVLFATLLGERWQRGKRLWEEPECRGVVDRAYWYLLENWLITIIDSRRARASRDRDGNDVVMAAPLALAEWQYRLDHDGRHGPPADNPAGPAHWVSSERWSQAWQAARPHVAMAWLQDRALKRGDDPAEVTEPSKITAPRQDGGRVSATTRVTRSGRGLFIATD